MKSFVSHHIIFHLSLVLKVYHFEYIKCTGQEVRAGSARKTLEIGGNLEAVF